MSRGFAEVFLKSSVLVGGSNNRLLKLTLILVGLLFIPAPSYAKPSSSGCDPIGRVRESTDSQYPVNSLVCSGDRPASGARIKLFCFWSGHTLSLLGVNWRAEKCRANTLIVPCFPGSSPNCYRDRGIAHDPSSPILVMPYGNTLMSGRPILSWTPVPGATQYTVQVRDKNKGWERQVQGTSLTYPQDRPALVPGISYTVRVHAYRDGSHLGSADKRLNVLPEETVKQLNAEISRIKALHLAADEEAYLDLNAAYSSRGLVNQAVQVLEARIAAGSRSPGVYRTLGDNFIKAGLPEQAKQKYQTATNLAKSSENQVELSKAQAGLQLVALLQAN